MVDAIATLITLLMFILPVAIVGFIIFKVVKKPKKAEAERIEKVASAPRYRTETNTYWVVDCDCAEKYLRFYRDELEENDDYNLSAKELKEDFCDEKVYKFEPLELPLKMEGLDVYSYRENEEWEKIGRLKKTSDINGELELYLYPNTYKYVTEEGIDRETADSYFGVTVTKKVML